MYLKVPLFPRKYGGVWGGGGYLKHHQTNPLIAWLIFKELDKDSVNCSRPKLRPVKVDLSSSFDMSVSDRVGPVHFTIVFFLLYLLNKIILKKEIR